MRRLLVTGGAGFIGSNFVKYWRRHHGGDELTVLDALTYAGNRANLEGAEGVAFVHGDIRDTDLVEGLLRDRAIDTLVHFAAESHVDRSILGPDAFVETNVVGTHSLLKAARAVWLEGTGRPHRFHHVTTDEVYGSLGAADRAVAEGDPYAPNSPYAASKAASDHLVRAYARTFGLQTTLGNCVNNYGPFQFPEKLIALFTIHALLGRTLPIYGDGLNARCWLHVEDHCRAIECILERGRPGETYNIGGTELTNLTIIEQLCTLLDRAFAADPALRRRFPDAPAAKGNPTASLKSFVADRPGHDRRYAMDDTKLRRDLGYRPQRTLEAGLAGTVDWYLRNPAWWEPRMSKTVGEAS
jgi:dTDP-glucose 4,6-dehydratase